jgi:hypothetical protein
MVVFSSELLAYYDLTFIILVSTGQARGIQFCWLGKIGVAANVNLHGTSPWHLSLLLRSEFFAGVIFRFCEAVLGSRVRDTAVFSGCL